MTTALRGAGPTDTRRNGEIGCPRDARALLAVCLRRTPASGARDVQSAHTDDQPLKRSRTQAKVFGIGLAKTGTTSLNEAFALLGLRTKGCPYDVESIRRYDAATDGIVADQFEDLDRIFPDSKFIYTIRNRDPWLESYRRYSGRKDSPMPGHAKLVQRLYGTLGFDPEILAKSYDAHDQRVRRYFVDRPRDLLIVDISEDGGWDELCAFLGKPVPEMPFPHSNPGYSDRVFQYLLSRGRSPEEIASVTRARLDYLKGISIRDFTPEDFLNEEPTKRSDKVLASYAKHFGGIAPASRKLDLPKSTLHAALRRHRARKRLIRGGILNRIADRVLS